MATLTIRLDSLVTDVEGECDTCHFDALRRIRLYQLTPAGVTTRADRTYCGRCKAEERRGRDD